MRKGILGLLVVLASGCGEGTPSSPVAPEPVVLRGDITYLQRIALPPDATARVVLLDISDTAAKMTTVATQELLEVGQVPIPFELKVPRSAIDPKKTYGLKASIADGNGTVRWAVPELAAVQPLTDSGPIELRVQPTGAAEGTEELARVSYACDGLRVTATTSPEQTILLLPEESLTLPRAKSASGAKYAADGTVFWSKARISALVEYRGKTYRNCVATSPVTGLGDQLQAYGNEPFWSLRLIGSEPVRRLQFAAGIDDPQVFDLRKLAAEPVGTGGATAVYAWPQGVESQAPETAAIAVRIVPEPCRDSMSGQPYPLTVTVEVGDTQFRGCGGRTGP